MQIYEALVKLYPNPPCPLDHSNAFQLLCSVILSAQARLSLPLYCAQMLSTCHSCAASDPIRLESLFPQQSTDRKVNEIVPPLYAIAPDAQAMAALDVSAPGSSWLHVHQHTAMASVKTSQQLWIRCL